MGVYGKVRRTYVLTAPPPSEVMLKIKSAILKYNSLDLWCRLCPGVRRIFGHVASELGVLSAEMRNSRLPNHRFWALWYEFPHIYIYIWNIRIVFNINDVDALVKRQLIFVFYCMAASAFSERYLGSKTDSRVYTVKLPGDAERDGLLWRSLWHKTMHSFLSFLFFQLFLRRQI